MLTKVQKWGNSLALRIPKSYAADAQLHNDSLVEISFVDGQIVVKPIGPQKLSLAQLLSEITSDNIHHETDTGLPVGNEIW